MTKQKLAPTPPRSPVSAKKSDPPRTITHDEVLSAERASIYKRITAAIEGNVPSVAQQAIEKQQLLGRSVSSVSSASSQRGAMDAHSLLPPSRDPFSDAGLTHTSQRPLL